MSCFDECNHLKSEFYGQQLQLAQSLSIWFSSEFCFDCLVLRIFSLTQIHTSKCLQIKKKKNKSLLCHLRPFSKPVKWVRIWYQAHLTHMLMELLKYPYKTLSHSLQTLEPVRRGTLGVGQGARIQEVEYGWLRRRSA